VVRAIAELSAADYDEPSMRDARRRIVAFFRTHLGDGQRVDEPACPCRREGWSSAWRSFRAPLEVE